VVFYGCEASSLPLRKKHRLRVFENRVPGRIFGLMRDEVIGDRRKLHNESFITSSSITRMIKSRKIKWAGHVARMGKRGIHIGYWWQSQKERDRYKDLDVAVRIILVLRSNLGRMGCYRLD
jgi:hypothetical protein